MGAIVSQITSLTIVFSTVYLDTDQRKHESSASLAFVRGIHRRPVNSPHKWPVTRKMFPFDDVIMSEPDSNNVFLQFNYWISQGFAHATVAHMLFHVENWVMITFCISFKANKTCRSIPNVRKIVSKIDRRSSILSDCMMYILYHPVKLTLYVRGPN